MNSLILKTQDIAIFGMKFRFFSKLVSLTKLLQVSEIGTKKISSWTGKNGKQDIAIFGMKFRFFSKLVSLTKLLQISEISTKKISSWTGKNGKHREFVNRI